MLLEECRGGLRDAAGLVEKDDRVRRDEVDRRVELRIEQVRPAVGGAQVVRRAVVLGVRADRLDKFFVSVAGDLLFEGVQAVQKALAVPHRGQDLSRGKNFAAAQRFGAALRVRIEKAHGVDFVAPELAADGVLVGRGEKVEDAAAARKLARALDLTGPLIAAEKERLFDLLGWAGRAVLNDDRCLGQLLRLHRALQKPRHGADRHGTLALCKRAERPYALLFVLAGNSLGAVKVHVARKQRLTGLL